MERRIVTAALSCFAQYGVSKTTIEDVASAAGCSRATLYRYFPGKAPLLLAVVESEIRRLQGRLDDAAAGTDSLEELVVAVLTTVGDEFDRHEALRQVLAVEPEVVLPHLAFDQGNRVLALGASMLAPHLARHVDADESHRAAEWLVRVALTYLLSPSDHVTLTDESSVRRLVRSYVLPGLRQPSAVPAA